MNRNETAEPPFNINLQTFLAGEVLIQIVRRNGVIYKFTPGIKAKLEDFLELENFVTLSQNLKIKIT